MSQFTIYVVLITLISIFGLIYTYRIAQHQKGHGEYDSDINENVKAHPYTINPVMITYIAFIVLSLGYMLYVAFRAG